MPSGLDGVNLLLKGFDLKSEILFTVCMRLASCKPVKHWLSTDFCYGWIPCLTRIIPTTSIAAEFPTVTVKSRPSNRFESNSIGTFVLFPKFANNGEFDETYRGSCCNTEKETAKQEPKKLPASHLTGLHFESVLFQHACLYTWIYASIAY